MGKSTVFNGLTGLHQHTGNWAGKTVANAQGYCQFQGEIYRLVDLPGCYSLLSHSPEEEAARDFLSFGERTLSSWFVTPPVWNGVWAWCCRFWRSLPEPWYASTCWMKRKHGEFRWTWINYPGSWECRLWGLLPAVGKASLPSWPQPQKWPPGKPPDYPLPCTIPRPLRPSWTGFALWWKNAGETKCKAVGSPCAFWKEATLLPERLCAPV